MSEPSRYCADCHTTIDPGTANACATCGARRPAGGWPADPLLGTVVAGQQYRVLRRVGAGGFGVVYEVETVVGGLRRALKVLHEMWHRDPRARERFVNEALVLEGISHPNVARCYSAGALEDGRLYLLFEFIDGQPLDALLADASGQPTPVAPLRAVRLARQVAAGLAAAHARLVLHRDLKPANLLIVGGGTPDEHVKLLDFGVARVLAPDATATAEVLGTPAYMAPEQFSPGATTGVSTDLWQLGATIFAMLTGRPPYAGGGPLHEIVGRLHRAGAPGPRPSSVLPSLEAHPALDGLVAGMLATDPADRPSRAGDVVDDLSRIEQALAPPPSSARSALLDALCAQSTAGGWISLCRYLQSQDDGLRQAAESRLEHWPMAIRRGAAGWWATVRRAGSHPLWSLVRALDLSGRGLTDADVDALADSPALARIRVLNLAGNRLTSAGVARLVASPHLGALESLDLGGNRVEAAGLRAIVAAPGLSRLTGLCLAAARVDADGVRALADARFRLRHLDLADNQLRTGGTEALARLGLDGLTSLVLRGNLIGPDGAALLAVSDVVAACRSLDLARNAIGPSGAAALAISRRLTALRQLDLSQNNLGREGLHLLLASQGLDRLEALTLASNGIGANGAMALAASMLARRLRRLDVADNGMGDAGLAALLGAPQLTGLGALNLAQNDLTPAGLALFEGAALQVSEIDLSDNPFGRSGAATLGRALGQLRVTRLAVRRTDLDGGGLAALIEGGQGALVAIDASSNALGPDGLSAVADRRESAALRTVTLNGVGAGEAGPASLAASPHLTNLAGLALDGNGIGDGGVAAFVARSGLAGLEFLSLADNGIGPAGAAALAAAPLAARLRRLDLSFNRLADAGAEAIAHAPEWPQLSDLLLRTNGISLAGASALEASISLDVLQAVDLTDNPLEGETDLHGLSRDTVSLLERSFARLASGGATFAARFYERLFETFPGVRPMFGHTSMPRQRQHLFSALTFVIDHLRTPDAIEGVLRDMGRRHAGYGVTPSQYHAVTAVLLDVLAEQLGREWTDELHDAWATGLEAVARVMMNGHRLERRPETPAPAPTGA